MQIPLNDLQLLGFDLTGDLGPWTAYTNNRGRAVLYPRASPLSPPSDAQQLQRDRLTEAATAYANLDTPTKAKWQQAARRASLRITGYNLWCYWWLRRDTPVIATISQQSGIDLLGTLPP